MKASVGRILMLVENHFPSDTRIKNECDLLKKAGYAITVVALKKKSEKKGGAYPWNPSISHSPTGSVQENIQRKSILAMSSMAKDKSIFGVSA